MVAAVIAAVHAGGIIRFDCGPPQSSAATGATTTGPIWGRSRSGPFSIPRSHEGGGAVFVVSNDRTGTMSIRDSSLDANINDGFQTPGLPGIFFLGAGRPRIIRTILR